MGKYYVQSGNIKTVISADDPEKAALWVIHKTLQQVVPVYDDCDLSEDAKNGLAVAEGLAVLGNEVTISEQGFERSEVATFDTFDLVDHWNQLMVALDRLASHLDSCPPE